MAQLKVITIHGTEGRRLKEFNELTSNDRLDRLPKWENFKPSS